MKTLEPATTSSVLRRAELDVSEQDEMHQLLAVHFEGVTRSQFKKDLAEKSWVILIRRGGRLVGFTTLDAYETVFEEKAYHIFYSGDTIVAPEAWNSTALPRAWIGAVNQIRSTLKPLACYWLLLTSGFRTYRLLPVFWNRFFPCFAAPTPEPQDRLLRHLAGDRFGDQYLPQHGIVRFHNPQRLRAGLDTIPEERLADPHIAFFAERNPGHAAGDELVCLTELSPENLTPAGRRMAFRNGR